MIKPFFTIIVPVYNLDQYIGTTLNTIKKQTFSDYEVLCINDGSTDESGNIINEFAANDDRFKAIHKLNGGVSSARNLALEKANGQWIVFVDGDDAIRYDGLELIYKAILSNQKTEIVAYGVKFVNQITQNDLQIRNDTIKIYNEDCRSRVSFNALNHYTVWTAAFSKKLIKSIRFENLKNGEDQLFYNNAILKANYYTELNSNIYFYLQRTGSAVNSKWTERKQEDLIFMNRSITENLLRSTKKFDKRWIIRWIKNLLYINDGLSSINKKKAKFYIEEQRKTLCQSLKIKEIPLFLYLWVWIVSHIRSIFLFKIISGLPVSFYNSLSKIMK